MLKYRPLHGSEGDVMLSSAEPYDDVPEDPEELRHAEESTGSARAGHKIVVWILVALIVLGMTLGFVI